MLPLAGAVTECEMLGLPSLQLDHTYRVPEAPAWGEVVAMVWLLLGAQLNV